MPKILVPVAGSPRDAAVIQHVVREFLHDHALEIHVLNVQTPFCHDVARFVRRREREAFYREQAQQALRPCRERLDRYGVPHTTHFAVGDSGRCIAETAHRLRCDHILLGTGRKGLLARLLEDSVTNRVLEHTTVPVKVIAGEPESKWERYGIPAAVAALVAMLIAAD